LQCLKRNINKRWIPDDYHSKFQEAHLAFLHQWVYDMDETDYVRLNPLSEGIAAYNLDFLGKKPMVKDLTLLRVNKIIPKKKDLVKPVHESPSATASAAASVNKPTTTPIAPATCLVSSITKQVIAYIDSVKENIEPHNYHARYSTTIKEPLTSKNSNKLQTNTTATNTLDNKAINKKRRHDFLFDTQLPPSDNNERRKRRIVALY
jgi:hypothetical protein